MQKDQSFKEAVLKNCSTKLILENDNTEDWENGTYGTDERYVARAPAELEAKVNAVIGLQPKT